MIGKSEELNNYVLKAQGLSRAGLNVMCFIGVFIFGWLLIVAFDFLGKKGKGWWYGIPIIIILVSARRGAGELYFLAPIIYIAGCIHANLVLSRYESLAKQRISEIDGIQPDDQTTDVLLERGLLKSKVLRQTEKALGDLTEAIQLPGGDPQYLNVAGLQFSAAKRFKEAKQFFDRALELTTEKTLTKQIQKNQKFVEKRLK